MTVLVAEHDPQDAGRIAGMFQARGDTVQIVRNAAEALAVCARRRVDVVVSRVVFHEGINGVELAEGLEGTNTRLVLRSPFHEDVLHMIPGFPPAHVRVVRGLVPPQEILQAAEDRRPGRQ